MKSETTIYTDPLLPRFLHMYGNRLDTLEEALNRIGAFRHRVSSFGERSQPDGEPKAPETIEHQLEQLLDRIGFLTEAALTIAGDCERIA